MTSAAPLVLQTLPSAGAITAADPVRHRAQLSAESMMNEIKVLARTNVDVARKLVTYMWNDARLLMNGETFASAAKLSAFMEAHTKTEARWLRAPHDTMQNRVDRSASAFMEERGLKFSQLLASSGRFVVVLASADDPFVPLVTSPRAAAVEQPVESVQFPLAPNVETLRAWQLKGFGNNVVCTRVDRLAQVPTGDTPQWFGTCRSADEAEALEKTLERVRDTNKPPVLGPGLLVAARVTDDGQLEVLPDSGTIALPMHALGASCALPGFENLLAVHADDALLVYNVTRLAQGPVARVPLRLSSRVASSLAFGGSHVAVVDHYGRVEIVPFSLRAALGEEDGDVLDVTSAVTLNIPPAVLVVSNAAVMPTAAQDMFYVGTLHGYVFELMVYSTDSGRIAQVIHMRSFYAGGAVRSVVARGDRVLVTLDEKLMVFMGASVVGEKSPDLFVSVDVADAGPVVLRDPSDVRRQKRQVVNAALAGNLLVVEQQSRNLLLVDLLHSTQRPLPLDLGTIKASDDLSKAEAQEYARKNMPSALVFQSSKGVLRVVYASLTMESWLLNQK